MARARDDELIERLAELSDANLEAAQEIKLLLDQAIAEAALDRAAHKTQTLLDNVAEARRLVTEYQARSQTPQTPEN